MRSLSFMAQFNCNDLTHFDYEGLLPTTGILSFFYEIGSQRWGFDPKDRGSAKVYWFENIDELKTAEIPNDLPKEFRFPSLNISLTADKSLPEYEDLVLAYPEFDGISVEEFIHLSEEMLISYAKNGGSEVFHKLVMGWNFDNEQKLIPWIIDNKDTDIATAHLIYWLMEPGYYKEFSSRDEVLIDSNWYIDDFDLVQKLENNILSGYYKKQTIALNPYNDHYGTNHINHLEGYELKGPIDERLKLILEGDNIQCPVSYDGIPLELIDEFNALVARIDE